jgi:glycine betaine/proline transport system ATP-binding protein
MRWRGRRWSRWAWGYAGSYPDELSGGMQQRVGWRARWRAIPSILLMDEAFSALDPIIRTEMQSELLRLQQIKRRTIVFISHDLDEAMRIGDRVAIMKDGHVVQVGTPEEILRQPANDYVRNFVRGVDAAAVFKASDIARKSQIVVSESPTRGARRAVDAGRAGPRYAYVVDPQRSSSAWCRPIRCAMRWTAIAARWAWRTPSCRTWRHRRRCAGGRPVRPGGAAAYAVPVVASDGSFHGAISKTTLLKFLDRDSQKGHA